MKQVDALVVGGGPAGASAAHLLASGGATVLLVEKARLPRYKPCGGGIIARSRRASPLVAAYEPETMAWSLELRSSNASLHCELPEPIGMVMRSRFDAYLVDCAARAGAEIRDGSALTALDGVDGVAGDQILARVGTEQIQARYVIGADGANGVTARFAGFPPPANPAVALEAEMRAPQPVHRPYQAQALIDFSIVPGGYAWIFGKADGLSVGIGKAPLAPGGNMHTLLQQFVDSVPGLDAATTTLKHGHRIPLAGGRSVRRRGAVLLAGDAASLADPITGEGISYALASGRRAGASILAALAGAPEALAAYDHYLHSVLEANYHAGQLISRLMYRSPDLLFRLLQRHAGARSLLTGGVCGTIEYRQVLRRLIRRFPALLSSLRA